MAQTHHSDAVAAKNKQVLYTIGHSTRGWEEFVALLKTWGITDLVDVRTVPKSRRYPWFGTDQMASALPREGITYSHLKALGGFRPVRKDSPNTAWKNESFRGYADYVGTDAFAAGLEALNAHLDQGKVCVMCSEAVWWRCHRRLIADAELIRGIEVRHIMNEHDAPAHTLTPFAVVEHHRGKPPTLVYPQSAVAGA